MTIPNSNTVIHNYDDGRINKHDERKNTIQFFLDGKPVQAFEGETVATAIFASGKRDLRISANLSEKRSVYCGVGVCYECVMTINNVPNTRSCRTLVKENMDVKTQNGDGVWNL